MKSYKVSGLWTLDQKLLHINILELLAVFYALKELEDQISLVEKRILVQTDNSTVVAYLNKQGGTRSPSLCLHTRSLLLWCIQRKIKIMAVHILGVSNILTDSLSRGVLLSPSKWSLSARITQTIFHKLRIYPIYDRSVCNLNKQTVKLACYT